VALTQRSIIFGLRLFGSTASLVGLHQERNLLFLRHILLEFNVAAMNSMQGLSVAARWAELDSCLAKLVVDVNSMRQLCHVDDNVSNASMRDFLVPPDAGIEAHTTRDTVVATIGKLQLLVAEPSDLLSQLAVQVLTSCPKFLLVLDTESWVLFAESNARLLVLAGTFSNPSFHSQSR
jgi:hypothetical protein